MSNKSKGLFSFILYIYLTLVFFGIISLVFLSIFNSGSPIFGTVLLAVSLFAFAVVISNLLKSRQSSKKRMKYIAKQSRNRMNYIARQKGFFITYFRLGLGLGLCSFFLYKKYQKRTD